MGILGRLLGRRVERERGMLADTGSADVETPRPQRVAPTRGTRIPNRPEPTPTTRTMRDPGVTAGTRSYGGMGGTPSTRRIHNSPRPGR
jgi:hypothetical protein